MTVENLKGKKYLKVKNFEGPRLCSPKSLLQKLRMSMICFTATIVKESAMRLPSALAAKLLGNAPWEYIYMNPSHAGECNGEIFSLAKCGTKSLCKNMTFDPYITYQFTLGSELKGWAQRISMKQIKKYNFCNWSPFFPLVQPL